MKKHITFNRLLHNDKLMLIVSLVLAIALWAWADFDQSTIHEMTVSNVPVGVSLSSTATETLGLRIVEGANVTAKIKVVGTRADLRKLRENSIHVEARAQDVTEPNPDPVLLDIVLPGSTSSKCQVVDVSGTNISKENGRYYLTIKCETFIKEKFTLSADQVEIPNLTLADAERMRFGTFEITGLSNKENKVTVYGPQYAVNQVYQVCAVVSESKELSKIGHFKGKLVAYDKKGNPVDQITFADPSSGEVGVIVPVVVYQTETLTIADEKVKNAPTALLDKLAVSPGTIELGELPEKQVLDSYMEDIRENLTVDFDHWLAEENKPITQTVVTLKDKDDIEQKDGVYLDRAPNYVTITLDVEGYTNQTKEISLTIKDSKGGNVQIVCDDGYVAVLKSASLRVTLCGPKAALKDIKPSDIQLIVDAKGQTEGHTVSVRPVIARDDMWVYFGSGDDAITYEIEYEIVKDVRTIADAE